MVVYTVRGLQDGEVCSIRKFLDVELGEFNRKLLLRKSTEAGRNSLLDLATRRDIDLLETVDEDELFELLIQDYLLGISRRLFVQKFRSLDRDGTHRVWARDVKGLLHELVVQRAEKLHEEELNIHRSGVSGKNLRNLRIDSQASLTGDSRHVSRQGSRWDVLAGASARSKSAVLSTRNLRFMEETSTASNGGDAPPTVVSPGSAAPGETRQSNAVYVRYSVQDLKVIEEMQRPTETSRHARQAEGQRLAQEADQRSPGERDRAHTTPSSLIGRDPFQERPYTLQGGNYSLARVMAAAYDYGPRAQHDPSVISAAPRHQSASPPYLIGMARRSRSDFASLMDENGIVTQQVFLMSPNHSTRSGPSQSPIHAHTPQPQLSHREPPWAGGPALPPTPIRPKPSLSPTRPSTCPNTPLMATRGTRPVPPDSLSLRSHAPEGRNERPSTVSEGGQAGGGQKSMRLQYAKMRPMSRYKQHQGSNLMTRDYTPSRAELRLGWAPARPKQKAGKQRAPIGHAMLSDIKAKERPTASSLNARLQALQQVRQMEACKRATLLVDV